jgi:large subunit ribosomal protein L25
LADALDTKAGFNVLIHLDAPDSGDLNGRTVMVRDLQRDPLSRKAVHADLIEVRMDQTVEVEVPIQYTGRPKGVLEGGILQEKRRSLELRCLPDAIPLLLEFDVTDLGVGDALHLRDVTLPEGVEAVAEANIALCLVIGAAALEAQMGLPTEGEAAAAGEAAEGEGADAEKKAGEGAGEKSEK